MTKSWTEFCWILSQVLLNVTTNHAETPVFVCYWAFVPSFLRWRSILGCLLAWWSGPCPTHPQLSQPGERQTNFGLGLWMWGRFHCSPFGWSQFLSSKWYWYQLTGWCAHWKHYWQPKYFLFHLTSFQKHKCPCFNEISYIKPARFWLCFWPFQMVYLKTLILRLKISEHTCQWPCHY